MYRTTIFFQCAGKSKDTGGDFSFLRLTHEAMKLLNAAVSFYYYFFIFIFLLMYMKQSSRCAKIEFCT